MPLRSGENISGSGPQNRRFLRFGHQRGRVFQVVVVSGTARVRGLVVVTRNVRDFEMFRVEVGRRVRGRG
jgi:hypothetical protein